MWETDQEISTLDKLGPFIFPNSQRGRIGYLLDGHQRLATLAGALVPHNENADPADDEDPSRWDLAWNMDARRFQHGRAEDEPANLFPMTALLDTLNFFEAVERLRQALGDRPELINTHTADVSSVSRAFQHYRVPVVRIRQTGLTEAVEIFARLNSKGQAMSADQMVGALMYRQGGPKVRFDLASEIDRIETSLAERSFGDVDRTTILRCILANIDEDIYRTDWTRLASDRREVLLPKLRDGAGRTARSLELALDFLADNGVHTSRLLPYMMQLVLLSSFFDLRRRPSSEQVTFLRRWFWVSSFAGWFGGANTSRVSSLVGEFRRAATVEAAPQRLRHFDMSVMSLPFPAAFDMRSARTRSLLLVTLALEPRNPDGTRIREPWREIAEKGPGGVVYVYETLPQPLVGNPANRIIRPPGSSRGVLNRWILHTLAKGGESVLRSHGLDSSAMASLAKNDVRGFVIARQNFLIECERQFQSIIGVVPSEIATGNAPIDTE